jgi:hypothetical protein
MKLSRHARRRVPLWARISRTVCHGGVAALRWCGLHPSVSSVSERRPVFRALNPSACRCVANLLGWRMMAQVSVSSPQWTTNCSLQDGR